MDLIKTKDCLNQTSEYISKEAVKILLEKKGIAVKLYDVREQESITDFYVVVTGRSLSHVASLADDLLAMLDERGRSATRIEGKRGNPWILVDYLDVIVHIFDRESRDFYNFERLLPQDSSVDITDLIAEVDIKFETNKN